MEEEPLPNAKPGNAPIIEGQQTTYNFHSSEFAGECRAP
jgi:hypothetical protein